MNWNERMTPKQSIIFVIVIAIAVFIAMQIVYGQETGKSMVDKLAKDTLKEYKLAKEYKQQLLNRILNSTTCQSEAGITNMNITSLYDTKALERVFQGCVARGSIK